MTGRVRAAPLSGRFRRFYGSSATSNLADGIGRTALPLLGASYTHSPLLISGLASFSFLPWLLFALPSGALVDRVDRRQAMAAANAVRAVAVATLAGLVLGHAASIIAIYAVSFALGFAETVYDSASRAILPQLVVSSQLEQANGWLTIEETLGQTLLGAPLGSMLFAVAGAAPLLLNTGGFVVAIGLLLAVRGNFRPRRDTHSTLRRDIGEGLKWLVRHRLLRGLTLVSAATAGAQSMAGGLLVLYVLEVLQLPAGDYGLVLLGAGIGGVLGGVCTPALARRFSRGPLLMAGAFAGAMLTVAMGLTHNGYVGATLFAIESFTVMIWNVLTMSLRQSLIPEELFGRVQGAYRTLVFGAVPVGSLLGGVVAGAFGVSAAFVLAGGVMLICAAGLAGVVRHNAELLDRARETAANGPQA